MNWSNYNIEIEVGEDSKYLHLLLKNSSATDHENLKKVVEFIIEHKIANLIYEVGYLMAEHVTFLEKIITFLPSTKYRNLIVLIIQGTQSQDAVDQLGQLLGNHATHLSGKVLIDANKGKEWIMRNDPLKV